MQDKSSKRASASEKASTMPTSPRAPPEPPSVDALRIGDMADLRAQDLSKLYTFAEDREEIYISRLRKRSRSRAWSVGRKPAQNRRDARVGQGRPRPRRRGGALRREPEEGRRELPPLLLITFAAETNLPHDKVRTVCAYGHLDVQPAKKDDGWDSEPFV